MVWGCFYFHIQQFLNVLIVHQDVGKVFDTLKEWFIKFIEEHCSDLCLFQQDNAVAYRQNHIKNGIESIAILVLQGPPTFET